MLLEPQPFSCHADDNFFSQPLHLTHVERERLGKKSMTFCEAGKEVAEINMGTGQTPRFVPIRV